MLGEAAMSKGVSFDAEIKGIWRSRISAQLRESAALKLKIEGVCADAILEAAWLMAGSLAAGALVRRMSQPANSRASTVGC